MNHETRGDRHPSGKYKNLKKLSGSFFFFKESKHIVINKLLPDTDIYKINKNKKLTYPARTKPFKFLIKIKTVQRICNSC